jgi:hypothetical protein
MAVPTSITDLSTTAGDNSPAGTEAVLPNLDDYLRAHAAFIKQTYDGALNKTSGGTVAGALVLSGGTTISNTLAVSATTTVSGNATFSGATALGGSATATTQSAATNNTTVATTAFVTTAVATLASRVTAAENDITAIESAATTLTGRVTTAEADIVALEANALVVGTFTARIEIGGTDSGITYGSRTGRWTQQGQFVNFWMSMELSSKGGLSGNVTFHLDTLPNVAFTSVPVVASVHVMTAGTPEPYGLLTSGTNEGELRFYDATTGLFGNITGANLTNITSLYLAGAYLTT